jgi:hypothetical protein
MGRNNLIEKLVPSSAVENLAVSMFSIFDIGRSNYLPVCVATSEGNMNPVGAVFP